ncbi:MAG: UTRA domain-containing protein [Luteitalea sp.]|nr:UTRA domain-containing protein [Luteitalea sp.]
MLVDQAESSRPRTTESEKKTAPIYRRIADDLKAQIEQRTLQPGAILPPERELCERYAVSRMTVRHAYGVLERAQLIRRQPGQGTFVAPKRMQKLQHEMRSFSEEVVSRGGVPSSRLLRFARREPDEAEREFFDVPQHELVWIIRRVRLRDEIPLALETAVLPCHLCPDLDRFNLVTQSLYRVLENEYGLHLDHSIEEMSAARPDRQQKKVLEMPAGGAVLVIRRKAFARHDTPVEIGLTIYRADMYTAIVRAIRTHAEGESHV